MLYFKLCNENYLSGMFHSLWRVWNKAKALFSLMVYGSETLIFKKNVNIMEIICIIWEQ